MLHPSTLVIVGGIAKFLKDVEDYDEDDDSEELHVYNSLYDMKTKQTVKESGNEIWEEML